MKKILISDKSPAPIGPYSQAVGFDNLIFTSGQIALDTDGKIVSSEIEEQTCKAITNIKNILEDNGSSLENVIKTTVFLKDMNDFNSMNEVYNEYFKNSMPARSTVEVSRLPKDVRVEIEAIAFKI
ncbi:MAG: RidA family protein [Ignavibacteria bacterium]|nr:RidA family protein [Ignavibacteria bacterium]